MLKYANFSDFLRNKKEDYLRCSFKDIEKIIEGKLPSSAYKFEVWWSNSDSHPLMKRVLREGWNQKNIEMFIEYVDFDRVRKLRPTKNQK